MTERLMNLKWGECIHRHYHEEYGIYLCDLCNGTCAYDWERKQFAFKPNECKKYDNGKMKKRNLRTCEIKGTIIEHREISTRCKIVGAYVGGFFVNDLSYKSPFPLKLPFRNINQWDVIVE